MNMLKMYVNETIKDAETWSEVLEELFARIEGAYEYEIVDDEETKRVLFISNEAGEKIAEVSVRFYLNENYDEDDWKSGKYIVETELLEGELNPLFLVYTSKEAAEKWGL